MTDKKTSGITVEIKKLEHSEIEIVGEIPAELFDKNREQAIKNLSKNIELPGFRKGHVPEAMLTKHIGEKTIMEEMAEITIGKEYKNIIVENKLDPISRPEVGITKIAAGNPLGFTIKVAVMPNIEIGDYKKIAKEVYINQEKIEVNDKEVDDTIAEIRKSYAKQSAAVNKTAEKDGTKPSSAENRQGSGEVKKDEKENPAQAEIPAELKLPEFNDEFVKTLGNFKDVPEFKKKLKENILLEKEKKAEDKKRLEMMEKIIADSKIDLPRVIIEAEQNKMLAQLKSDIERMGMKFDDYMKQIKKTEEDIQKETQKEAEKRAKIQLLLNKIGIEEKITAPKEMVDEQVEALTKQDPEADKERVRIYVETNIVNQKIFEFLEGKKEKKEKETKPSSAKISNEVKEEKAPETEK